MYDIFPTGGTGDSAMQNSMDPGKPFALPYSMDFYTAILPIPAKTENCRAYIGGHRSVMHLVAS